jgi:aldoxime dehydratase
MTGQQIDAHGHESSIRQHLAVDRTCPVRMREGHTPPYPSYSGRFGKQNAGVICAMLGVQSRQPLTQQAQDALREIWDACETTDGPASREVAASGDLRTG